MYNKIIVAGHLQGTPKFYRGVTVNLDHTLIFLVVAFRNYHSTFSFMCWGSWARFIANCVEGENLLIQGSLRKGATSSFGGDTRIEVEVDNVKDKQNVVQYIEHVLDVVHKGVDDSINKWNMKDAYEANKKEKVCVVCGKVLFLHPSVGIMYCKCVENLPK